MLWQLGWLLWDDSPEWSEEKQDIYLGAADASTKLLWITSYESMVGGKQNHTFFSLVQKDNDDSSTI